MQNSSSSGRSLESHEDIGVAVMRLIKLEKKQCYHEDTLG